MTMGKTINRVSINTGLFKIQTRCQILALNKVKQQKLVAYNFVIWGRELNFETSQ
jgi:hypothetical protein